MLGHQVVQTRHGHRAAGQAPAAEKKSGLFSRLKEVYLFGCNTLRSEPRYSASAEIARSLDLRGWVGLTTSF